jgi:hypothetical protein
LIGDGMVGLSVDQPIESYHIRNFRSVNVPIILSDSLNLVDFTAASSGGIQAATKSASDIIDGNCGGTILHMRYAVRLKKRTLGFMWMGHLEYGRPDLRIETT